MDGRLKMSEFEEGDKVLVDINGVDVPATITDETTSNYVEVDLGNIGELVVDKAFVKHDPSQRVWRVGDKVTNAEEAVTLKDETVFRDSDGDIGKVRGKSFMLTGLRDVFEFTSSWAAAYPWEVLWVDADTN